MNDANDESGVTPVIEFPGRRSASTPRSGAGMATVQFGVSLTKVSVGTRNLTRSIFLQLVEEPIFDWERMVLRGAGWG
jgi:hypothetical protein